MQWFPSIYFTYMYMIDNIIREFTIDVIPSVPFLEQVNKVTPIK